MCFSFRPSLRPGSRSLWAGLLVALLIAGADLTAKEPVAPLVEVSPGVAYVNRRLPSGPWSIHIVQVDRRRSDLRLESVHAGPGAVGMNTLSEQVAAVPTSWGGVEMGINGDFYQRDRAYAGDSRGLQVIHGELTSAPTGGVAFWIDSNGNPRTGAVGSQFQVTFPDGTIYPVGLNEDRKVNELVVYTGAMGGGTRTTGGREWVLEPWEKSKPLVATAGASVRLQVRSATETGNTPIAPNTWVLSMGPALARKAAPLPVGAPVVLRFGTVPELSGVRTALGGGPVLVQGGKRLKIKAPSSESYEFSSMMERHPRSALGWNSGFYYFVEVDGRQKELSVGMTLEELGDYLLSLGCEDAMNLDGGGSSTLWLRGGVKNSPCDGKERPISNALLLIRRDGAGGGK